MNDLVIRSYVTYARLHGLSRSENPQTSTAILARPCSLLYFAAVPTFRFSGLRITVHDGPQRSTCLLSDPQCTLLDAGVRGCMRLQMRLSCC